MSVGPARVAPPSSELEGEEEERREGTKRWPTCGESVAAGAGSGESVAASAGSAMAGVGAGAVEAVGRGGGGGAWGRERSALVAGDERERPPSARVLCRVEDDECGVRA